MRTSPILLLNSFVLIMLSAPLASADVVVSCSDLGGGVAEFSYDASDEPVLIKAFALDITVNNGATIDSVFDYKIGESTAAQPGYGIFPGSIIIDGNTGVVIDWGTPIGSGDYPDTLPGLGTYGVTIEMASLYEGIENAPLVSDTLFKMAIDWNNTSMVDVDISLNAIRGGIVMEDPDYHPALELVGCTLVPEPSTLLLFCLGAVIIKKSTR